MPAELVYLDQIDRITDEDFRRLWMERRRAIGRRDAVALNSCWDKLEEEALAFGCFVERWGYGDGELAIPAGTLYDGCYGVTTREYDLAAIARG